MRLAGGILNYRATLRERRGEDDVHRRADRDLVEVYSRPVQPSAVSVGEHEAVFHIDRRAQRGHALYMLVDRAHTEVAPAGHSRLCLA